MPQQRTCPERTIFAFAQDAGHCRATVTARVKRFGLRPRRSKGRALYKLAELESIMADEPAPAAREPESPAAKPVAVKAEAEARFARARAERMEFDLAARKEKYILREDAVETATAHILAFKRKLLESCQTLPPRLVLMTDANDMEEELRRNAFDILTEMSGGGWYAEAREAAGVKPSDQPAPESANTPNPTKP